MCAGCQPVQIKQRTYQVLNQQNFVAISEQAASVANSFQDISARQANKFSH
jgi:hypothetical protein